MVFIVTGCCRCCRLQVQLVGLEEESSEFVCRNTFDHPYPTTKIMWIPDTKGVYPDLLATSGDYLRIWRVTTNDMSQVVESVELCLWCGLSTPGSGPDCVDPK